MKTYTQSVIKNARKREIWGNISRHFHSIYRRINIIYMCTICLSQSCKLCTISMYILSYVWHCWFHKRINGKCETWFRGVWRLWLYFVVVLPEGEIDTVVENLIGYVAFQPHISPLQTRPRYWSCIANLKKYISFCTITHFIACIFDKTLKHPTNIWYCISNLSGM